jgi:hypothetical protein
MGLGKFLEQLRHLLRRHAEAGVRYRELNSPQSRPSTTFRIRSAT